MSDTGPDSDLPEGDFNDFEQQIVDIFEQRGGEGDDAPADTSPPSPGGGDGEQASPDVASSGDAAPDLPFVEPVDGSGSTPAPSVEGQEGGEGVQDSDGGDPAPPPVDIAEYWDGVDAEQVAVARSVYDWYSQLDQTAVAQIDAALSGQYVMVPAGQIEALQRDWELLQQVKSGAAPTVAQQPGQTPDIPPLDSDETDPTVLEMQARVARLEQEQFEERQQQYMHQAAAQIDSAYAQWREDHPYLDDADIRKLENAVVQSGIYSALAQQHGDARATQLALDQMLYADPALRDKALQPIIDERLQQSLADAQTQQARGTRASAIAGSAPAPPSDGAVAMDPDEAMVEEIARAMGFQ